jgi:two-component system nitrate/nitrite response regulator NarL
LEARLTTIVVESRQLLREALESLMRTHSYSVASGARFAAEIAAASDVSGKPELVILGAQSTDTAITEAARVRKLWSDSKIVLLLESDSSVDLDRILGSEVDACVPLFVSAGTLMRTLDLIAATDARVLIVSDMLALPASPAHEAHQPAIETASMPRQADESETASVTTISMVDARTAVQDGGASRPGVGKKVVPQLPPRRILPDLSEREIQILDGLVKGHANKVIARTCDITEATVKVHIRSILRKIRVGNRTQAAIWALESGYFVDVPQAAH